MITRARNGIDTCFKNFNSIASSGMHIKKHKYAPPNAAPQLPNSLSAAENFIGFTNRCMRLFHALVLCAQGDVLISQYRHSPDAIQECVCFDYPISLYA